MLSTTQLWLWHQRRRWMCQEQEIGAENFNWPTFLCFGFIHFPFPMTCVCSCLWHNFCHSQHNSLTFKQACLLPLYLQSCRCFNVWDSPAAGHRQLCSDGTPGCKAFPCVIAPHCPNTDLRLCRAHQNPGSGLAKTQLHVDRLTKCF